MRDGIEAVSILIGGTRYTGWNELELHLSLDTFDTIAFTAPFEPENVGFRDTFRPFSFKPLEVSVNDALVFTGTLVGVDPKTEPASRSVAVSGYATPGVLNDVSMPVSAFPLELAGLNLRQIAERVLEPFGLRVVVDGHVGAAFHRVALKPDESPLSFLAELAKQRGFVITNLEDGRVHFQRSVAPGSPIARLQEGARPLLSVSPTFSPQEYFSEITGLASAKAGRAGSAYTVRNPRLTGVIRPTTFTADDTEKGDIPAATSAKLGRMFGNMVAYVIELPTWRDPNGDLWWPNQTLTVTAPGAMIYRETELLIRDVTLKQSAGATTASLGLVLPGAFSGVVPERLPWDE